LNSVSAASGAAAAAAIDDDKKRIRTAAIFDASAIVTKLTGNDRTRSVERGSSSIARRNANETTLATPELSRF
jgi:hypothetical protein